jgi:hypothetical protein
MHMNDSLESVCLLKNYIKVHWVVLDFVLYYVMIFYSQRHLILKQAKLVFLEWAKVPMDRHKSRTKISFIRKFILHPNMGQTIFIVRDSLVGSTRKIWIAIKKQPYIHRKHISIFAFTYNDFKLF